MDRNVSPDRRFLVLPLLILLFVAGFLVGRSDFWPGLVGPPRNAREAMSPFWEAWRLVEEHYVDRAAVNPERMARGAIDGMVASLGDTGHTAYLSPEDVKRLEEQLSGHFVGIGARLSRREHRPTIIGTLAGSPARATGLKDGDVLLQVDGKDVTRLSLDQVVEQVRGPAGTTVHLHVLRPGNPSPLDFTVTRAEVNVPDVAWRLLSPNGFAHITLRQFGEQADKQLRNALKEARQAGARGLLLDLRGNPGGLASQAVAVASEFLRGGTVYRERDASGKEKAVAVEEGGVATDLPLCLLIDEGTASSAEIVAGAVQDHGRGKLVGTHTFGTGTVLRPFPLSDGSAVLLAIGEWLTPNGRQIWHKGILPDVEVSLPENVQPQQPDDENSEPAGQKDPQVEKGIAILKEQLP